MINIYPKNSNPRIKKKQADWIKTTTNQNTEWIGLKEVIVITTAKSNKKEDKK